MVGENMEDCINIPEIVCEYQPDIVMLDQNLNYKNGDFYGTELIGKIKEKYDKCLFVARSANDDEDLNDKFIRLGFDGIINKSLKPKDMEKLLNELYKKKYFRN